MYNEEDFESEEDQIINEEYKLWKYNSHYLYDTLLKGSLELSSLTVSFLQSITEDSNLKTYKIILETYTTQNEQNYLLIYKITLSKQK